MKPQIKTLSALCLVTLALASCNTTTPSVDSRATMQVVQNDPKSNLSEFIPGEVIVKFKSKPAANLTVTGFKLSIANEISPLEYTMRFSGSQDILKETERVMQELQRSPFVEYAQLNWRVFQEPVTSFPYLPYPEFPLPPEQVLCTALDTPNDTLYGNQWHYLKVRLPRTWCELTKGVNSPRVAVIDTGSTAHPDLNGVFVGGYDFTSDLNNNDGDGWDNDPTDPGNRNPNIPTSRSSWHGSHVAGTIGAKTRNGVGVAGVNWVAQIVPIRVLGRNGGKVADIAKAIRYAAGLTTDIVNANPARVINMSIGYRIPQACDISIQKAINAAISRGVSVVVTAGNSNADASLYGFANCQNVIVVGALNKNNERADYSNYGTVVDVAAPGGDTIPNAVDGVLSTVLNDAGNPDYAYKQGTSMAAPHVTGIISLMHAYRTTKQPTWTALTPAQIERILRETATALPAQNLGSGLVNSYEAVRRAGTVQNP